MAEGRLPIAGRADRGRELADHRLGRARLYLLVDLPPLAPGREALFTAYSFTTDDVVTATRAIEREVGGALLRFDLAVLTR